MKGRLIATVASVTAAIALSSGVFALPAAADTSTLTTAVFDASSNTTWGTGPEVTGASAYDTSVVVPDVSSPAGGTLTYSLYPNGTCDDPATSTQTVTLNADGSVPNSDATGAMGAGTYSFQATYNGDGVNDPSSGVCEPFTVGTATSSTTAAVFDAGTNTAWAGTENAGARAYDTAIVTGVPGITPTGTVTYSFFDNGSCASDANTTTDTETLGGGVVPNSDHAGSPRNRELLVPGHLQRRCQLRRLAAQLVRALLGGTGHSHDVDIGLRRGDQHGLGRHGDRRRPRLRHGDRDRRARDHPDGHRDLLVLRQRLLRQ